LTVPMSIPLTIVALHGESGDPLSKKGYLLSTQRSLISFVYSSVQYGIAT
jgi:hypothetical protein